MIEPISRPVQDYLAQFGAIAIYACHDGEVDVTSPAGLGRGCRGMVDEG
jgi:hypothetical protein